ncbi:MAG: BrnT family toxin [Bryobacteraceae bacterium]
MKFEWDPQKAAANLVKHKVSFEEAATVFGDPLGGILADPRHSTGEERFALLGLSQDRSLLAVMYVDHGGAIRIISARRATGRERRNYEEITQ